MHIPIKIKDYYYSNEKKKEVVYIAEDGKKYVGKPITGALTQTIIVEVSKLADDYYRIIKVVK